MGGRFRKIVTWLFLFQKRLLKKRSFLVMMLLPLCLVSGMKLASGQESSMLRIVLYCQEDDEAAQKVFRKLMEEDSVIHYELADSEEAARAAVTREGADAAWMVLEDLQQGMDAAIRRGRVEELVTVLQHEDNMQQRLARMKLYAAIYADSYVYSVYSDFVEDKLGGRGEVTPEQLQEYYDATFVTDELFAMRYANVEDEVEDTGYLLAPLRGMLALWLIFAGLAAMLYFMEDEQSGLLDRVPMSLRLPCAAGYSAVVVADAAVLMLAALWIADVAVSFGTETLGMMLYCVMAVGFGNLLRLLCGSRERLGACIPVLLVGMLVLCPVFFDFRSLRLLQYLLPPYYYLKFVHSRAYLYDMAFYAVASIGLMVALDKVLGRCRRQK